MGVFLFFEFVQRVINASKLSINKNHTTEVPDFESGASNRSAILPCCFLEYYSVFKTKSIMLIREMCLKCSNYVPLTICDHYKNTIN